MAIIREGNQSVLLIIDVQVGVLAGAWQADRVTERIQLAVDRARSQGAPVIWVQHADDELVHGSPAWQVVPALLPAAGEIRINKQFNSAFELTTLDETLAALDATHIVLAGAATNWCVRATAYAALDRGYDLTLLQDAHTTETIMLENGRKIAAADIISDLNIAMTWLSYPGRTSATAAAADAAFST